MNKKDKKWKEEYENIKNELLIEQVSEAIKTHPESWRNSLEELGFEWVEDDDSFEIEEENNSVPLNENQEGLVAYFDGEIELTDQLIQSFIIETEVEEPNYPLFRKYLKSANKQVLQLLQTGLSTQPTNQALLSGISFYHEHHRILSKIIPVYTEACKKETDTKKFKELSIDFVNSTYPQGYDAIAELESIFSNDKHKLETLNEITLLMKGKDGIIDF